MISALTAFTTSQLMVVFPAIVTYWAVHQERATSLMVSVAVLKIPLVKLAVNVQLAIL